MWIRESFIVNKKNFTITSIEDGVGILQLNHPEKRNALGWELHEQIITDLETWIEDDAVSCVLIIGNEQFFCAGWRAIWQLLTRPHFWEKTKHGLANRPMDITLKRGFGLAVRPAAKL